MALNIIFMGTPNFAVPILKSINDSEHNILAVYTQRPKKKIEVKKLIFHLSMNSQIELNFKLDIQLNLIKKNVIT